MTLRFKAYKEAVLIVIGILEHVDVWSAYDNMFECYIHNMNMSIYCNEVVLEYEI